MSHPSEIEIERVARDSYGRLISILASATGNLQEAEDLLSDAILKALQEWQVKGIPESPEAWLVRVARNQHIDMVRRNKRHDRVKEILTTCGEQLAGQGQCVKDRRLELFFACTHPAIDSAVQTPLMLNAVLGLSADRIARAFLVSPTAMSQRLVRAKNRISALKVPFIIPDVEQFEERLENVLEAIFAVSAMEEFPPRSHGGAAGPLQNEAVWLARMLYDEMPESVSVRMLLALLLYQASRRQAQFDSCGIFVPLHHQNTDDWDHQMIDEADAMLAKSELPPVPHRFALMACIQSIHASRRTTGKIDWDTILFFYRTLNDTYPTPGSIVAESSVLMQTGAFNDAQKKLDEVEHEVRKDFQSYWVTQAQLYTRQGKHQQAASASLKAVELTQQPEIKAFLDNYSNPPEQGEIALE
jgi:RNA polymerase sigma-70 factor (ECF subfamily)